MLGTMCALSGQRCAGRHFPLREFPSGGHRVPCTRAAHCCQRFSGVLRFQLLVIGVGEFSRRAIELDFLKRAQGDGLRAHVVFGIVSFIDNASLLVARQGGGGPQDREQDEIRRARSQQDTDQQLNQFRRASAWKAIELVAQALELGGRRVGRGSEGGSRHGRSGDL